HTFYNTKFWTNPGGDFVAAASATANMFLGMVAFASAQLNADVQAWINNPATNFGWVITGDEINTASAKRIGTKENADPSARPMLSVDYSASTWKVASGVWSGAANWDFGIPDGSGAEANFTSTAPPAIAVAVDGA